MLDQIDMFGGDFSPENHHADEIEKNEYTSKGLDLLDNVINKLNPGYVVALFSGGHDSVTSTHIAAQHPKFDFAAHIDTGIGIDETRDYVRNTCDEWGVELREFKASECTKADGSPDPQIYVDIVKKYGFPGPPQHSIMYARLKERPLRNMLRSLPKKSNKRDYVHCLLITGVRQQESTRRMAHVKPVQKWGRQRWVAPIWDMEKLSVNQYMDDNNISRNPVVDLIHKSGECLCGAFAEKRTNERAELKIWYPDKVDEIERIERQVFESGKYWDWDDRPPWWHEDAKQGQMFIPGTEPAQMMCVGCHNND